ncbi:MAG: OB-fold nucleic acid binding domain-containing protein, partial [Patescibacteria group bacterium]|nr:OB-fold nucleic acid binding domain-containing protein [Patescibacteria group bacterium]
DLGSSEDNINKLQLTDAKLIDKKERMAWEKELLGLYVSDHPLKEYSSYLRNNFKNIKDLAKEEVNQIVKVGGIITKVQKIITKSGKAMVFAVIEDLTGKIEILVFPRLLESNQEIWEEGNIISTKGKLSDKDGIFKLLCEEVRGIDMDEAKKYSEENEVSSVILNEAERREKSEDIDISTNLDFSTSPRNDSNNNSINITIPKENSREILKKLSDILNSAQKGTCKVYISIPSSDGSYKKIKTSKDILCEEKVLRKIKDITGERNVK